MCLRFYDGEGSGVLRNSWTWGFMLHRLFGSWKFRGSRYDADPEA